MAKLTIHKKAYTRKAYVRRDGVRVKAARVPSTTYKTEDMGNPGRGKKYIPTPLKKGTLGGKGFFSRDSTYRHKKESQDVRKYGYKHTLGKLQAIAVFEKNTNPKDASKARSDRKVLVEKFGRKR